MKRSAALCVLGLLCLHSCVILGQDLEDQPEMLEFCDEPTVTAATIAAMSSFNERVVTGNKMASYQILSASKAENASGVLYSMKFTSRRSDCPAGDARPWTDCGYLAEDKKPSLCNATVYVSESVTRTLSVQCSIEAPVQSERASCLGCPVEVHPESDDLKVPISVSINKYNSKSNGTHLFMLNSVAYATRQVVAGLRYHLHFDLRKSNCSKAEHQLVHSACSPDDDVEFSNCNSTVDVADWRHEVPNVNLNCEAGAVLAETFTRRRPPGWSPLRSILDKSGPAVPFVSVEPGVVLVPSNNTQADEEESSEEEDGTKVTDPFHCPSEPWKKFPPAQPSAAAPAPSDASTEPAPADGGLTDLDLLG